MKNTKERRMIFSNVKSNKKKAEEKSASKTNELFDYDKEMVIGLKVTPQPKINKKMHNKVKSNDELDVPFQVKKQQITEKKQQRKKKKIKNKQNNKKTLNKEQKKTIFKITKWTTLCLALIGGLIYLLLSPVFNIKNINVSGNEKISADTIISISGITMNDNLFKIRKSEVIKKIKENSYIEKVVISKKINNTIDITIE